MATLVEKLTGLESVNFLLTNRVPRRTLTRFMGWYSKLQIAWLTRLNILIWRQFARDLDLSDSAEKSFPSLHACFTRRLIPGAREIDHRPSILVSPVDAIVGAHGCIESGIVHQIKGFPYQLSDLIPERDLCSALEGGNYVTLRLKSSFYHRFHAPCDASLSEILYLSGDTWNVNPIALKRIENLYCRNERAVVKLTLPDGRFIVLVPVAAILVASMRFHCLPQALNLGRKIPYRNACHSSFKKGDEIGYFEHGSTVVAFTPKEFAIHPSVHEGQWIRLGQPLFEDPIDTNQSSQ